MSVLHNLSATSFRLRPNFQPAATRHSRGIVPSETRDESQSILSRTMPFTYRVPSYMLGRVSVTLLRCFGDSGRDNFGRVSEMFPGIVGSSVAIKVLILKRCRMSASVSLFDLSNLDSPESRCLMFLRYSGRG